MSSEELDKLLPGTIVGPYRIVRGFRGRGGMARVFEVEVREKYRRPGFPIRMAMKVAKPDHQAALSAEADYLSRFDHPNVVRIFPILGYHKPVYAALGDFPFGRGWYYTMELLTGGSLYHHLCRPTTLTGMIRPPADGEEHPLHLLQAVGIARQLAAALEHIHQRFVINLDVKPGTSFSASGASAISRAVSPRRSSAISASPGTSATPAPACWASPPPNTSPRSRPWRPDGGASPWMSAPTSSLWASSSTRCSPGGCPLRTSP
jgi:hypothetical protein